MDEQAEEYYPINVPPEFRTLESQELQLSIRDINKRFMNETLVVEPDFQRHYVWDSTRASRYIESLLLGLPTPPIFVAEEDDERWVVVDGHQRLETLFRFMRPLLAGPSRASGGRRNPILATSTPLNLRALEVLSNLNGQNITALSVDDRRDLWNTKIKFILIPRTAHKDMKYVLFARLNLGSVSLNPQELRNCLYRGRYNRLIADLAESSDFLRLWGRSKPDKRMREREFVLSFFALLHRRDRYRTPFRNFLNDEMSEHQDLQSNEDFRAQFNVALKWTERVFTGRECFRRFEAGSTENPPGRWIRRRQNLMFEVECVGFGIFGEQLDQIYDSIRESDKQTFVSIVRNRLIGVMADPRFRESMQGGTRRPENQNYRFDTWMRALETIVTDPEGAIDDGHLLHRLLRQEPYCISCPYEVTWDDAVFAMRKTRIRHRYCHVASIN